MAKRTKIFLITCLFVMIFAIILRPDIFINSAKNALLLFGLSIFPSLFPFLFFSTILTSLGAAYELGKMSSKTVNLLFNAPPIGGYVWIMSLLSGFPVCAKIIDDCYSKNLIDYDDCKTLLTFSQTSPPLFVLGTVGITMLSSYKIGVIILFSQYLGSFLSGILLRKKTRSAKPSQELSFNVDNILQNGMEKSVLSVLLIGGYVVIFNLVLEFFTEFGIITFVANLISKIGVDTKLTVGIFSALFEVTNGTFKIASLNIPLHISSTIICFLLSVGGLSILMQSMSFLSNIKIKFSYFLKTRMVIGILSSAICYIIASLLL